GDADVGGAAEVEDLAGAGAREDLVGALVAGIEAGLRRCAAEASGAAAGVAGRPLAARVAELDAPELVEVEVLVRDDDELEGVLAAVVARVEADVVPGDDDLAGADVPVDAVALGAAATARVHVGPEGRDHAVARDREAARGERPRRAAEGDAPVVVHVHRREALTEE